MASYTEWTEEAIQHRAHALKALRSALRLRILAALAEADSNVRDLELHLRISQPLISWHLSQLQLAGFVDVRRVGREAWYSLRPEAFRAMVADLETLLKMPLGTSAIDGER
ncbi:MAG: winged helix-turn-helix transcriptional regulator [Anaerolineae bacterium]|nr:winged helix-turn-helix transcriptional regulator [Anaerolineae bacterium]